MFIDSYKICLANEPNDILEYYTFRRNETLENLLKDLIELCKLYYSGQELLIIIYLNGSKMLFYPTMDQYSRLKYIFAVDSRYRQYFFDGINNAYPVCNKYIY